MIGFYSSLLLPVQVKTRAVLGRPDEYPAMPEHETAIRKLFDVHVVSIAVIFIVNVYLG